MDINRENLAWCAGFFDGEGSTFLAKNRNGRLYPRLSIGQAGLEAVALLNKFNSNLGKFGHLNERKCEYKNFPDAKPSWSLNVSGYEKTQFIIAMIWPWLSQTKKLQAKKVLEIALQFEIDNPKYSITRRGESHHRSRFSNQDIIDIRTLHKSGITQADLARKYNCSNTAINGIVLKKTWAHI